MAIDERRIQSIVAEVLGRLESDPLGVAATPASEPLGVHADLESAIAGSVAAFKAFDGTSLQTRKAIVASIRETLTANVDVLSKLAVEETGLGRVEDKRVKNQLVIDLTPGPEDLEPIAWTGDHGLTLLERAPYGPIAVITPVTNPSETIINNGISMISGGNVVVLCPHPNARKVSNLTVDLMNRAAKRAGAPLPLLHSVEQPTLEVAQSLLRAKGIRLNVVTGGPAVVR